MPPHLPNWPSDQPCLRPVTGPFFSAEIPVFLFSSLLLLSHLYVLPSPLTTNLHHPLHHLAPANPSKLLLGGVPQTAYTPNIFRLTRPPRHHEVQVGQLVPPWGIERGTGTKSSHHEGMLAFYQTPAHPRS